MKKFRLVVCCVLAAALLAPGLAYSAAFSIFDQGAKAVAMGNAFVAQADDPTAVYYNPAGLTQLEGTQIAAGVAAIWPKAEFQASKKDAALGTYYGQVTKTNDDEFFIPNFYLTNKYNEKVAVGLGVYSNFGLSTDWPDNWPGQYCSGATYTRIKSYAINPVIAYQPWKFVSISAGFIANYMDAQMENNILMPGGVFGPDGHMKVEGDDWASGWNAGIMFYIQDEFRLGASYRSQLCHDLVGDITVTGNNLINMQSGGTLDINLPSVLQVGASWSKAPFTVEFDYQWTKWSNYNMLQLNVDSTGAVTEIDKNWDDAHAFRLGFAYNVVKNLDLRAGLAYEPEFVPNETLDLIVPNGDRWTWSCGFGGQYGKWVADFAYAYLYEDERSFDNEAGDVYNAATGVKVGRLVGEVQEVSAHILCLTVTRKF
ncbi:OmpP1/FadL family transporter [Desulfatibacillum aliphaticivorans]|uniref:Membrane protein involved in aromatic hydrocarbon degradation n=1 Tax=Desulfatibacillum aliphaticivorans TaxID=218208 RepID=B8F8W5_DESAL|nr:outer membrane protein transport protein [Desulfatibacillum aliphaticivorans]ACL01997.1 membrane protein involved in aromatic hydrocarbon degradation [Desulfatibacillum aliphaticivorans]